MRLPLECARCSYVLVTLLSLLQWRHHAATAADVCSSVPFKTLTLSCNGVCAANSSCIVYPSARDAPCNLIDASPVSTCITPRVSGSASTSCVYQCFQPFGDTTTFKFFVAFNSTRGTKTTTGASSPSPASASGEAPYESNEYVRRIGVLNLPASAIKVVISGGRNEDTGTRGQVVDVAIDPKVFSDAPELSRIAIMNTNLGQRLPDVAAVLPNQTTVLDLTNTNLTQVPLSLATLTLLDAMSLEKNFLTEIPLSLRLPELKTLFLAQNSLTAFATNLTELQYLDLSNNLLTSFPTVVFGFEKLNTLKLDKNPTMAPVRFTTSQFTRLSRLEEFSIDASVLDKTSCSSSQLKTLPQLSSRSGSVCVVADNAPDRNDGSGSPSPTPAPDNHGGGGGSGGLSTTTVAAIIVAVGLGGVVIVAVLYVYLKRRRNEKNGNTTRSGTDASRTSGFVKLPDDAMASFRSGTGGGGSGERDARKKARHAALLLSADTGMDGKSLWDDEEMISHQLDNEDIEDVRIIGSGGFAVVWLVKYRPQHSRLLASKRLIRDQIARQKTMQFVTEIKLNMQLVHPSIVPFVGVAWTVETDLQALFEYMSHGDLRSFLETTSGSDQDTCWTQEKLQIAIDIVEALVYVHSFSPPLVHRDLKSRNVLLAEDMKAKLSDFGVSRFQSESDTMTAGVGTGKWLAPEVIAGSKSYDVSCDIYAFGVLLSELDTHELPYEDLRGPQGNRLPEVAVLQMVASGQIKPTLRGSCPLAIRDVAMQCLAFTPAERPTSMEIAYALRTAFQSLFGSKRSSAAGSG